MADPMIVRWSREVITPDDADEPTVVCCHTDDGRPVALLLSQEYREALGLLLLDNEEVTDA